MKIQATVVAEMMTAADSTKYWLRDKAPFQTTQE